MQMFTTANDKTGKQQGDQDGDGRMATNNSMSEMPDFRFMAAPSIK